MDKKPYCTQNNGDCSTCSLVNYGRDCHNNPVGRGGRRDGAGRPATGRKRQMVYVTDDEMIEIKKLIEGLRNEQ